MEAEKCRNSEEHKGPFFTLTLVAYQSGPGSRVEGKKRRQVRYVLGRVCRDCIPSSLIRVNGKKLLPKKRIRRSGGLPVPKNTP